MLWGGPGKSDKCESSSSDGTFIILQKALQENNDDDTHITIKMRHTSELKKESVSVNLLPKYIRIHIYL